MLLTLLAIGGCNGGSSTQTGDQQTPQSANPSQRDEDAAEKVRTLPQNDQLKQQPQKQQPKQEQTGTPSGQSHLGFQTPRNP
jgi:hypothetical protein